MLATYIRSIPQSSVIPERVFIFIASHRRSGTHLLMNFIYNNFEGKRLAIKKLNHFAADESLGCACVNGMFLSGKVIYVEREFHAVLQSMFYYMRSFPNDYGVTKKIDLNDFLTNDKLVLDIAWMWFHTHRTWMQHVETGDVLLVTFNALLQEQEESLKNISKFLGLNPVIRTHPRNAGVLVGAGKGLQPPGPDVVAKAKWALREIESYANARHDYKRSWAGLVYGGNYPLDCVNSQSNTSTCPQGWHDGEVLHY